VVRRVVCDAGVVISGLLSDTGAPARLLDLWRDGAFELVISPTWIAELDRVVGRPEFARYVIESDATELRDLLLRAAVVLEDPPAEAGLTPDPGDDYLVALAREAGAAFLVSGDQHLLGLPNPRPPVVTPRSFVDGFGPPP
jgi:uncharacterized protein